MKAYIPMEVLQSITVPVLFYPCSDKDITEPVKCLAPYVTQFWFADVGYTQNRLKVPALGSLSNFQFQQSVTREAQIAPEAIQDDDFYKAEPPFVKIETYTHTPTGQTVTIFRTRRRGPSALRSEVSKIGVFFYRCDSSEGGSGTYWLTARKGRSLFHEVLDKLPDRGLVITDGSMCIQSRNPYAPFFAEANRFRDDEEPDPHAIPEFTDVLGNRFKCVGYVGKRYSHCSLVWQVNKR